MLSELEEKGQVAMQSRIPKEYRIKKNIGVKANERNTN
jgi:hypothetical protein|tara:strand:+ start:545 stop:658 length:114 start_codon:yes stop_codon:yes gene_type:complete